MMDWHPGWGMTGLWYGGWLMWVILLLIAGLAVYLVVRTEKGKPSGSGFGETPLDILKRRYARGDISKEEFESMKRDLEN